MEGIKRIKKLSQETKDSSLKKVADYLITREDMNNRYLNQDKDLNKMWKYIVDKARTQAVDGAAYIDDEEVYGWAIHYWDEPEEDLKKENKNKFGIEYTKVGDFYLPNIALPKPLLKKRIKKLWIKLWKKNRKVYRMKTILYSSGKVKMLQEHNSTAKNIFLGRR